MPEQPDIIGQQHLLGQPDNKALYTFGEHFHRHAAFSVEGNYVLFVISESADDLVKAFKAELKK